MTDRFLERMPSSRSLFNRAVTVIPAGISHDSRRLEPFPHYVARASGSRKWDEDGNEFIDYVLGHASLILGHGHPDVVRAVQEQIAIVTHPGACHRLEVEWASLICDIVPSIERVRFVMSGTEATLLAFRIARAYTSRQVIVRIQGHFHGWQDYVTGNRELPFDVAASAGVPDAIHRTVRVARLNDLDDLEQALSPKDVAAVILEPEGARSGTIAPPVGYLQSVREAATRTGALLIFDEIVSGFRVAPGGVQAKVGVLPDLTTLAKAVAGGLPGGAVGGRADVMRVLEAGSDNHATHQGTWNANPLSAAAGVAALRLLSDGAVQRHAHLLADRLRAGLNDAIRSAGVGGLAFGEHSSFRVILGDDLPHGTDSADLLASIPPARLLQGMGQPLGWRVHRELLLQGVDFMRGDHGWLSLAHETDDIDSTVAAFERVLSAVVAEGGLSPRSA